MSATGKSPDKLWRGGNKPQRRPGRVLGGYLAVLLVLLLAVTLPWHDEGSDVHALRTELADARAQQRAAAETAGEDAPEAFGGGVSSGSAGAGDSAGHAEDSTGVRVRALHADRRVRDAQDELDALLADLEDAHPLAGLAVQIRSLVGPPRDPDTAGRLRAPVQGLITSGFGPRMLPSWGDGSMHDGIDIFAPSGTPVGAAGAGEAVFAGWRRESGLSVVLHHGLDREGRDLETVYSHLSSIDVREGQQLDAGEVLGAVGNTGTHTTGPHLHFEVRLEGEPVDPRAWL